MPMANRVVLYFENQEDALLFILASRNDQPLSLKLLSEEFRSLLLGGTSIMKIHAWTRDLRRADGCTNSKVALY